MSKKKTSSGSTMTLKDFHGGSIPSDLPLPSAPGITVKPQARAGYDLPSSWGSPSGRSDLRVRLNSSNVVRHFDDKTPFLTPIGRNFEEDERKPLDGVSAPRRTISDDSFRASAGHLELKPQQFSAGRPLGQGTAQVLPSPSQVSYSGRVSGTPQAIVGSPNVYGNGGPGVHKSVPNAWVSRKEPVNVVESAQPAWSSSSYTSKLVHASALEKVSSGRWNSKQSTLYGADVEDIKHFEETGLNSRGYDDSKYDRIGTVGGKGYGDVSLLRQMERSLSIGGAVHGAKRDVLDREIPEDFTISSDERGRNAAIYGEASQLVNTEGRTVWSEFQRPLSAEASEQLKLRLVSQSKPLENCEQPTADYKQRPESAHVVSTNALGVESGSQTVERPKLNLKPRSRPLEQSEGIADRDRSSVFGGARPRELVLKERGVDDSNINDPYLGQSSERAKQVGPKVEWAPGTVTSSRHSEKSEKLPADQRNGRKSERKDQQQADDKSDSQRKNWRNENWKSKRDNSDRQQHQQERRPSPEIWRKPVEEPKPPSPEAGLRFGKAASAAELAQAFSGSRSSPNAPAQLRATPGQSQSQVPFSRLTGQAPRTQINGY
ncbi:hypothetical protein SAY86_003428 [Trapa natans]|uniref:Uncharacterized protein n=1 Tax=Trapa natans TaxID=22666 RepID=A0AAN7RMS5_TRANT|nr:hypothetical protein SAY86_003428 [Trapa natans]